MTWFNLHHGQMRIDHHTNMIPDHAYFRPVSPKKEIQMHHTKEGRTIAYRADEFGNIEVTNTQHLNAMMMAGWPINRASRTQLSSPETLLYPHRELNDDPYHRIILSGMKQRVGE